MKLVSSCEAFQPAASSVIVVMDCVERFLNIAFEKSSLANLELRFQYVPIVMPEGMRERYPARSKARKKDMICDCSPQLDYEIFVSGKFEDQLKEYVRGIGTSVPLLDKLGATKEQLRDFEHILAEAVQRILVDEPDQVRQ